MPYSDFTKSPLYRLRFTYHYDLPQLIRATDLLHVSDLHLNPFDRALYGLPIPRVCADKILLGLKNLTGKDFTYEEAGIVLEDESLPTLRQVVERHHLTLQALASHAGVPLVIVQRIDERREGAQNDLRKVLTSLRTLTGTSYTPCENMCGFFYLKERYYENV
ncbi:MAG: hypothetical protein E6J34_16910 [Chloroflexi bacterium]|nr:MAG: hypothetical protein E6J34_16910 [Chloroflexota bacterium]